LADFNNFWQATLKETDAL